MAVVRTPIAVPSARPSDVEVVNRVGRYTALGYRAARVAVREGRSYPAGSGDFFLDGDRPSLIAQSRSFYRNNGIYRGILDRAVSYIIGRGFGLRVLTRNPKKNQAIEAQWKRWHAGSDIRGLLTSARAAGMVCREAMLCGDTGVIKRDKRRLQYIEAEQITTGRSQSSGIDLDDDGRPVRFHVCAYNPRGQLSPTKRRLVEAKNFLFLTTPGRPSQTRGEPILQSSFPMLHRISDVCDSEALAWQVLSRLALSITREDGDARGYAESVADPNKPNAAAEGDVASRLIELDWALIFHARPGDKVEGVGRNIPGENFTESLRTFLRLLGLPIGMPLELILLDWSQANYSQSRAVLEQAYQCFCDWQDAIELQYYAPLLAWQLPALLADAGYAAAETPVPVEWIKPTFPWIDQLKEAQAHGVKIDRCLTTHAHVLKELNLDREEVVEAREIEIADAIGRAAKIFENTGVKVPWQIFAGLQAPKAVTKPGLTASAERNENVGDGDEDGDRDNSEGSNDE